jgi:hypothetical protein
MYSPGYAVLGGIVGGLAFLMVVVGGYAMGMTRMNFLQILGTMMAPRISRRGAYALGFMIHMMIAAGFGLLHGAIIDAIGVSTVAAGAGWGLALGAIHGAVILVAMPMLLTMMHPLVRKGEIERPGVALTGFGPMTPIGSLMAHVAFGVVVASIYAAGVVR